MKRHLKPNLKPDLKPYDDSDDSYEERYELLSIANYTSEVDTVDELYEEVEKVEPEIRERFQTQIAEHSSKRDVLTHAELGKLDIEGKPLTDYFNTDKLDELENSVQSDEVKKDVLGILTLIASYCDCWVNLSKSPQTSMLPLVKEGFRVSSGAALSTEGYQAVYDPLLYMVEKISPEAAFIIDVAARIFMILWPQRKNIANWIVSKFEKAKNAKVSSKNKNAIQYATNGVIIVGAVATPVLVLWLLYSFGCLPTQKSGLVWSVLCTVFFAVLLLISIRRLQ